MEHKLLYVASTFSHILQFHRPCLEELARRGWTIHVACGGPVHALPAVRQIHVISFDKHISLWRNRAALGQLRRLLIQEHYELVSSHTSLASCLVRLALWGLPHRPKVLCTVHGYLFDGETPRLRRWLLLGAERINAPVTDGLLTMNRWDTDCALRYRLAPRVRQIPGMGLPSPQEAAACPEEVLSLRRSLGIPEGSVLFVYPAEFSPRKSHHVLLQAMAQLPDSIVLALPGQGALRARCMEEVRQLQLSSRVFFPGQVDMDLWYRAADALVSASRSEGLPFHILEAMSRGLPIAAPRVKGITDLIRHEQTGLLYPWGDSAACARQMARLAADPALCQALGRRAAAAAQPYRLDQVLPRLMACYPPPGSSALPLEP